MITGEPKSKVDRIWDTMWVCGIGALLVGGRTRAEQKPLNEVGQLCDLSKS